MFSFRDHKILLISPQPWQHIAVSKHHYARTLAQMGSEVYFLNPPATKYQITDTDIPGLRVIDYPKFIPGMRFLPAPLRHWLVLKKWKKLESLTRITFDVIWSFDNSVFYDFNALPKDVLSISHIVDINQNFMTGEASKTADLCLGVSKDLVARSKEFNENSYLINHGYGLIKKSTQPEWSIPGSNLIKAMYVGNLSMRYLDWNSLYRAAQAHPEVDFIFIGPNEANFNLELNSTHESKRHMMSLGNVYTIGQLPSHQLYAYLQQIDLLLVCYQKAYFRDQTNPHKMLEYLGSGKPVVATFTKEYVDKQHLIYMSEEQADWLSRLNYVLDNLEECSSEHLKKARIDFALDNTYEKQIKRIEKLISDEIEK